MYEKLISFPLAAKLLLAINIGVLLSALTLQVGFDIQPCVLCLWQRAPYGLAAALAFAALFGRPQTLRTTTLLGLCAGIYLIGMGIAVFHTGVEQHWWLGTSGCAVQPLTGGSPEEMRKALLQTMTPRCDEISWTILGFSLANINIGQSLLLAFYAALAAAHNATRR